MNFDTVVNCLLALVGAFIIFPAAVEIAANAPGIVLAFIGAGIMFAIYGDEVLSKK